MPLYGGASTGTYRQYADRASFDVSSITVAAWIKYLTVPAATTGAISRGVGNSGEGDWRLGLNASGFPLFNVRYSSAAHAATAAAAPVVGAWNHYIGRYVPADSQVRHYINGVLDGTAAGGGAIPAGTQNIRIFEATDGTFHANAVIALFGFWNVGLDDDERAALVAGANPATIRPDALVICDQFDSRTGFDTAGMVAPTDAGNLVATPRDFPYQRNWLDPMPGPRNITRRRRALPATGAPTGTGAATTAAATSSGAGRVIHKPTGTPNATAPAATSSGAGLLEHSGTGAATAPAATSSGAGRLVHPATGAATAPAATTDGDGRVVHGATGTGAAGAATSTGAGRLVHGATGTATAGACASSGAASVVGTQTGTGSATCGAVSSDGAGRVVHRSTGSATSPSATCSGIVAGGTDNEDAGPIRVGASTRGGKPRPYHPPKYRVFDTYSSKPTVQQSAQAVEQEQARVRKVANRRAAILSAVMAASEDDYGL